MLYIYPSACPPGWPITDPRELLGALVFLVALVALAPWLLPAALLLLILLLPAQLLRELA